MLAECPVQSLRDIYALAAHRNRLFISAEMGLGVIDLKSKYIWFCLFEKPTVILRELTVAKRHSVSLYNKETHTIYTISRT